LSATNELLVTERVGTRFRCILNRPESHNALNPELLEAIASAVASVAGDDSVQTLTIEGAGTKAFSAGFDIKVMASPQAGQGNRGHVLQLATDAVAACPKPTFALIRGYCFGAGFDLAMACDFRIASRDSRFAVPAIRLRTVYEPRSVERIWRVLGPTVTKQMFMLGRELNAEGALHAGVVQELVEPAELQEAAERWAMIPAGAMDSVTAHKRIIDAFVETSDRSEKFWAPLDALRLRSLEAKERARAVEAFTKRGAGPAEKG
jgi:enoyl-CoA hydratase